MPKKRIAIVGAGIMGTNHARTVSKSNVAKVNYIVDVNETAGNKLARSCGATWVENHKYIKNLDAAIIATPTDYHYELALDLVDAGIPVLVEKPITPDLFSTEEILKRALSSRTPLTCGLVERFNPAVMTALELMNNPIHFVSMRHSPYTPRIAGGVAWDLLIHDVDLAHQVFGNTLEVCGTSLLNVETDDSSIEDIADVLLKTQTGSTAFLSSSRVGQSKIRTILIYEKEKMFELDLLRRDLTVHHNVMESGSRPFTSGVAYSQQSNLEIPELVTNDEPLLGQLKHFNSLIEGKANLDIEIESILVSHTTLSKIYAN